MNFASILPILLASLGGQEKAFAVAQLTTLLTAENTRVNAGLAAADISATVTGLVNLAFAEQTALVNQLVTKTK